MDRALDEPERESTGVVEDDLGQQLAQFIALLVDSPEDVTVERAQVDHQNDHRSDHRRGRRGGVVYSVRVAPDDVGMLIGRQGRTARALRSLLAARSALEGGERYELEIRSD